MPDESSSRSPIALMAALGAAVGAFMILALATPRWSADDEVNWLVTIVGSLVVGALAYVFLATRKAEGGDTVDEEPPR